MELNAEPAEGAEKRVRLRVLRVLRVSSPSPPSFDANSITELRHSSLATLEILVHLNRATGLQPHVWYEIEVPDELILVPTDLPEDWAADLEATRSYGDRWIDRRRGVALRVPSALAPAECNLLLNPAHPDFRLAWVRQGPEPLVFDRRLLRRK
ncbi:MAG: RES domain-containing protein [Verrucomicrobia bacterium]|nr:RES domain-containing protein [Verrucomicrobiota bacterium]